jgi:hypothetical protein
LLYSGITNSSIFRHFNNIGSIIWVSIVIYKTAFRVVHLSLKREMASPQEVSSIILVRLLVLSKLILRSWTFAFVSLCKNARHSALGSVSIKNSNINTSVVIMRRKIISNSHKICILMSVVCIMNPLVARHQESAKKQSI